MKIVKEKVGVPLPAIEAQIAPQIKLSGKPQITIAIPCGDKEDMTLLHCNDKVGGCGKHWLAPGKRVPNLIPAHLMLAYKNLQTPLNTTEAFLMDTGRLSAEARQIMTKRAIQLDSKYILYWDDDTIPPSMALYDMHNWMEQNPHAGAISAVYVTRQKAREPLIYKEHGAGAWWDFPMGEKAWPVPIFGAGAGFMLARIEAIKDVMDQMNGDDIDTEDEIPMWLDERTTPTDAENKDAEVSRTIQWGHDMRFCHLLNKHGWPVYVDGRTLCGHLDIATGTMYSLPSSAPGFLVAEGNLNTQERWNAIYEEEGADTWRQYPEMFEKVVTEAGDATVLELGCGVGVLADKLNAHELYKGYELSDVAVGICKEKGHDVEQFDIRLLTPGMIQQETVIATEVLEHLNEADYFNLMNQIDASTATKFIFTVPDNCMGPEHVREHTALFNEDLVRHRMRGYSGWSLRIEKADEYHLICTMER